MTPPKGFSSSAHAPLPDLRIAAAYIRVSTDDQVELSPASQLVEIRKWAARNVYIVPDEFVFMDEGISGRGVKKRDEFRRMIGVAKTKPKPFDAILLWKFKHKKPSEFNQTASLCLNAQESQFISRYLSRCINRTYYQITEKNNFQVTDGMVARSIFAIRFGSRILSDPAGHKTHLIGSVESIFLKHPIASKKLVTDKLSAKVHEILNLDHEVWTNPWDNSIASTTSFPDLYHQTLKKCNAVYYYLNAFLIANVPSGPPDMSALLAELGNYSYHSGLDVG